MLLLGPGELSANGALRRHGTSLCAAKGKKPDLSLVFSIHEIKDKPPAVPKRLWV